MNIDRNELLQQLATAQRKSDVFLEAHANQKNRVVRALRDILYYRLRYLLYQFARRTNIALVVPARMFWGEKIFVPLPEGNGPQLLLHGVLQKAEEPLMAYLTQSLSDDAVVYDVGANVGEYALLMSFVANRGSVHAFEPDPAAFRVLSRNAKLRKNVHSLQCAVSDRDGSIDFYSEYTNGRGTTTRSTTKADAASTRARHMSVESVTVDTYTASHTPPTFIKLDIEGGEASALEGAKETLAAHHPTIAMEVWYGKRGASHIRAALSVLKDFGYMPHHIEHNGTLAATSYETIERHFEEETDAWDNMIFLTS